jgi:hypothetical protein
VPTIRLPIRSPFTGALAADHHMGRIDGKSMSAGKGLERLA